MHETILLRLKDITVDLICINKHRKADKIGRQGNTSGMLPEKMLE